MSTPPPSAPAADPTDSELGRHLLTLRGLHFVFGALGDPYAERLRGEEDHLLLGERIRARGALHRSSLGTWVTADADLAARLLEAPLLSGVHAGPAAPGSHVHENVWETWRTCHTTPLGEDFPSRRPADCDRLADLLRPVLGPRTCGAWRPDAERAVHRVLDDLPSHFDLVRDLARPVAIGSLTAILGLPDSARAELLDLMPAFGPALDSPLCPPRLPAARALTDAIGRVRGLMEAAVAARSRTPAGDALSALLAVRSDGGPGDVATAGVLSAVVGAEITATTVANSVLALLDHRDQWSMVCADPSRAADAVEETLRWAPPLTLRSLVTQGRLEIGGEVLEADEHVVVVVDAAQRDPKRYKDPDSFRIDRPRDPGFSHLALTDREHARLVAPLVRVQCTAAVRALAERLPALRTKGDTVRRGRSPVVRAPLSQSLAKD
ncbi:P450-derived glycosyltransferase activator [Streptomyces sp. CA-278952]|uniref:cytochrome P450 family protein n=1 Tax=Streptomyces sp. CA-278952 TaxID=2980556 RepID=UPI002367495C|nr:P450-derived glycosyltransferase activator [Streptomyces sp. CA-278952]WDG28540.1 P450-derived glycosyltransferase activator [Streptomyces sp. CA-278952]